MTSNEKDCKEILVAYRLLQDEIIECYKDAKDLNCTANSKIIHAMSALEQSMALENKAATIGEEADALLAGNACCCQCHDDLCECKVLEERYICLNNESHKHILETLQYLKASLASLEMAIKFNDSSAKVQKAYANCVSQALRSTCLSCSPCKNTPTDCEVSTPCDECTDLVIADFVVDECDC